MKLAAVFFLILGLSLFQTTLLPINLLLILVIIFSLWQKAPESFVWAFLAGLFLDLFSFNQLGFSSIIFVSLDLILKLYRQRFSLDHPLVISFVLVTSYFLYSWLTGREIGIWEAVILLVVILVIRLFRKELFLAFPKQGKKLKL